MFNSFPASWLIAIGAALFAIASVGRVRARHKLRDERHRMSERLRKFERKKSLEPVEVEAFVEEILRSENSRVTALQSEASKDDDDVDAVIEELLGHRKPSTPQRTVSPKLTNTEPPRHASPDRGTAQPSDDLPLSAGTKVRAVRNVGSVKEGTFGIITGATKAPYFGPRYQCTFANNIKIRVRPTRVQAYDHEYDLEQLEHPDFAAILSKQMVLKAQQLFSRKGQKVSGKPIINADISRQPISA